jgi:hypothetical protein
VSFTLRPVIPYPKDKEAEVGTIAINKLLGIKVGNFGECSGQAV